MKRYAMKVEFSDPIPLKQTWWQRLLKKPREFIDYDRLIYLKANLDNNEVRQIQSGTIEIATLTKFGIDISSLRQTFMTAICEPSKIEYERTHLENLEQEKYGRKFSIIRYR